MAYGFLACLIAIVFISASAIHVARRQNPDALLSFGIGLVFAVLGITWIRVP